MSVFGRFLSFMFLGWRITAIQNASSATNLFTSLERIRGQWPYSLRQVMSSVSANDAPVTRHIRLYRMYTEKKMHAVQRTGHALNGLWTDLTIEQVLTASMKSRGGLTHGRGLTDSVRNQWVHTMHHRSGIHLAMGIITGRQRVTSPQHAELGKSRHNRGSIHRTTSRQTATRWSYGYYVPR